MALGDRLGLAGLIVGLVGIAAFYLWPDEKLVGWLCLAFAILLVVAWLWSEVRQTVILFYQTHPVVSTLIVFVSGGFLAASFFLLVMRTMPPAALLVGKVEVRIFRPQGGHVSGFWLYWSGGKDISPIDALLFVRVRNEDTKPMTITGYEVESGTGKEWMPLHRLDLRAGYTITTTNRPNVPHVGNVLNFPAKNKAAYLIDVLPQDLNYDQAAILELPILDNEIANKSLPPNGDAEGWVAVDYRQKYGLEDSIRITFRDSTGKAHFSISKLEDVKDGEIAPHLIQIVSLVDVSQCRKAMLPP